MASLFYVVSQRQILFRAGVCILRARFPLGIKGNVGRAATALTTANITRNRIALPNVRRVVHKTMLYFMEMAAANVEWMKDPLGHRCCFYEDGKHRCLRPAKWCVERATHFDCYCQRHVRMRLA